MINTDAEKLYDEIQAGNELRAKHLEFADEIRLQYQTRFFRSDQQPKVPTVQNHAYEVLSILLPALMYDNPQCELSTTSGGILAADQSMNYQTFVDMLQEGNNRWAVNSDMYDPMFDAAINFFFSWAVMLTVTGDQPGYNGRELIPRQPYLMSLEPHHMAMDACAKHWNPQRLNGPRLQWHLWKADKEDLIGDPDYDEDEIANLILDDDLDTYDPIRKDAKLDIPDRDEILAYDVWIPEIDIRYEDEYDGDVEVDDPAVNGTIYTIGFSSRAEGTSKRARMIRKPRPAYCGPWGPYTVMGFLRVPGSPYPFSPLVATWEQADALNMHKVKAANDAANFKRIGVGSTKNAADAQKINQTAHGHTTLVDSDDIRKSFMELTIGGVDPHQNDTIDRGEAHLNRTSGMTDALRGEVQGTGTATENAIANAGTNVRKDGIRRRFRHGVTQVWKAVTWFNFHGEDIHFNLGDEAGKRFGLSEFWGGTIGRDFPFFEMAIKVEPTSYEHSDNLIKQRNLQVALQQLFAAPQAMISAPFIKYQEPLKRLFETLDITHADDWIDDQMLAEMQGEQREDDQYEKAIRQVGGILGVAEGAASQGMPQKSNGKPSMPKPKGSSGSYNLDGVELGHSMGSLSGRQGNLF